MFGLLAKDYPGLHNVKFAGLTKDILASTFRVPRSYLDGLDGEPKWREQQLYAGGGKLTKVTPILLLSTLFHGAQKTDLGKLNVEYALENIPSDSLPVFTDVRREYEYEAIVYAGWNPYFIYLGRDGVYKGVSDEDILTIAEDYVDTCFSLTTDIQADYERLKALICPKLKLAPRKPTLKVFYGCNPTSLSYLPNYEPAHALLDHCYNVLESAFNLPQDILYKRTVDLFQAIVNEADTDKLELTPVTKDCWMKADHTHVKLFPRLREQANLKFYFPEGKGLYRSIEHTLTTEEIANVQFI